MILIDDVLVSDEVISEQFVCDLNKCRGGCCVDGDCGAPLSEDETKIIAEIYPLVKSSIPMECLPVIESTGTHSIDNEYGYVTPTLNGGICVYGFKDVSGTVLCVFEKAWKEGKIGFRKPISCHLYPIRIKESEGFTAVNYEPREDLCAPACRLGSKLRVPVYQFLKEPIIRRFGSAFYGALESIASKWNKD